MALVGGFLAVYAILYFIRRRFTGRGFGGIGSVLSFAAVLIVFCFPYPAYLLELPILAWAETICEKSEMEMSGRQERPTVIFVLGGGISAKTSVPSSYSLGRITHGLEILQREPDAFYMFSDGGLARENGTEWMRRYLIRAGVPPDRLLLEEYAASTQQNFELGMQLLEDRGLADARVILVTSSVHVPRAYYTARHYGFDPIVDPLEEHTDLAFHPSWFSILQLSAVLNEYLGVAGYWILGWI